MSVQRLTVTINDTQDGQTVHTLLRRHLRLSGTLMRRIKWLEDGILLDGHRVTTRETVHTGQTLSVRLSDPGIKSGIPPVHLPLDLVFEDGAIVVVNKAPAMPSHPGPGHWGDSLGNALMAHWQETDPDADFHPVHRLDKGTSGLMVVAKHPYAQEQLRLALHTGDFHRSYLAVCDGHLSPASGTIDLPIGRCDDSILKRQVRPDGQQAVTHYTVLQETEHRSLLSLTLETGRTHQIRVHLAALGHPLTGDFLYGIENKALISRPALHSHTLRFRHPVSGEGLSFSVPLPDDMSLLLK